MGISFQNNPYSFRHPFSERFVADGQIAPHLVHEQNFSACPIHPTFEYSVLLIRVAFGVAVDSDADTDYLPVKTE